MTRTQKILLLIFLVSLFSITGVWVLSILPEGQTESFNSSRAYQDVINQCEFGPRTPGSAAHASTVKYIMNELIKAGWQVEIQETEQMGHPIRNIIAKNGNSGKWVILGAHYDSRLVADQEPDPQKAAQPVPGANDGASGVAVLLELARVIPSKIDKEIWLVFFDAEDQGRIPGWEWILGSNAFVESLVEHPDSAIIVDMIGDADLNVYREISSDGQLTDEIWQIAESLGFGSSIIDQEKFHILDDHLPFLQAGIPAIDMIDFDYPYWHTLADTPDKVSPQSLEKIGLTLITWLTQ